MRDCGLRVLTFPSGAAYTKLLPLGRLGLSRLNIYPYNSGSIHVVLPSIDLNRRILLEVCLQDTLCGAHNDELKGCLQCFVCGS